VNEKTASTKAAIKKKSSKNNSSINIGLVAGIDLSTVKFTHSDNAGYNFGLMAGYQFNRRWSVYTGVIYTKKNYALEGSDYHPPKHYWTQYVNLQTVEGYCRMWELPLLARYNFNPGAKTVFFTSTGLSSYFMKKQQYNYSYKNNMNQQLSAAWSNDSTFNHVFSILHLSAGFEKPLGRHMNWQIEPYAKIPLGGVGFGNIRLSSFGVNFSVQYRQRIRR
jgi:Outer membrane protein beta-barrel domain